VASSLLWGTVILAIWTSDAIHIGVDSKVVTVGPSVTPAPTLRKIHQNCDIVFAHAGLFKDTLGKLDVVATADAAIAAGGMLKTVVERFATDIQPQLLAAVSDIQGF
jgi:hypothetical protein